MAIRDVMTGDALPALEMAVRFAAQRQRVLAHNIANVSTPDFRPLDADPGEFQRTLGEAIDRRRSRGGRGALEWRETEGLRRDAAGDLRVVPSEPSRNILFHDRNNRDLERQMQDLTENVTVFRASTDLLKSRYDLLRTAIAGRL